jgi:hypothetical protein
MKHKQAPYGYEDQEPTSDDYQDEEHDHDKQDQSLFSLKHLMSTEEPMIDYHPPTIKIKRKGIKSDEGEYVHRPRKRPGLVVRCTVCETRISDDSIKRQVNRHNVNIFKVVFQREIECGRVCDECLKIYNNTPCQICGDTDFRGGTLALKQEAIQKYEEAFGMKGLVEGKVCRGCYGKFYTFTKRSPREIVLSVIAPPVKRHKTIMI